MISGSGVLRIFQVNIKSFDWDLGLEISVQFPKAIMLLKTQQVHTVHGKKLPSW